MNKEPGYENFYVWHPGRINATTGERSPPSNWLSNFRYGAWEWNEKRQEYYLHQFIIEQPDLNYRDPLVVENMKNVLRHWLGKGVSGFRVDAIPVLFEVAPDSDGELPDEPVSGKCSDPDDYCYLDHLYTTDLNETFDMVYQWRETLEDFRKEHGGDARILMTEAYTTFENYFRYYGDGKRNGSHIPFNFYLLQNTNRSTTAEQYSNLIGNFLSHVPAGSEANWVVCII